MANPTSLAAQIAEKANCTEADVQLAFNDHGVPLTTGRRAPRHLKINRLRIRGEKAGVVEPGPFDETFRFPEGVTVIAADNFRGKTSILEIIAFVLRGTPRDIQSDTLLWLATIAVDITINGQPIGFRVELKNGVITHGAIITGQSDDVLENCDDGLQAGASELQHSEDPDEWVGQVSAFMLARLGLEEIFVFNKGKSESDGGIIKSHGWPLYFSAIYPPSGAEKILLGNTVTDFLPVRLMQVFLDLPDATRAMRLGALAKRLGSEHSAKQKRQQITDRGLADRKDAAEAQLKAAELVLQGLETQTPAESLETLSELATTAGEQYASLRSEHAMIQQSWNQAKAAKFADERAILSLKESAVAGALFHGLDPTACPRCESVIDATRRKHEIETHQCAVCETPIHEPDSDEYEAQEKLALASFEATSAAEKALSEAFVQAEGKLAAAQLELENLDGRLSAADAARQLSERATAELNVIKARAALEALEGLPGAEDDTSLNQKIFEAAELQLKEHIKESGMPLYEDLNEEVRRLGLSFGINELEQIRVKPQGQMDVTKGGGAVSSFSSQSPGERLRLRYALVVGLLRIARQQNVAGHPGVLLLDSLKAEEVQDDHAQTLLEGLVAVTEEEPGLQIIVTTADRMLAGRVSGVAATIEPKQGRTSLF